MRSSKVERSNNANVLNLGENMPSVFSAVHVATSTPNPVLFCVTAFSDIKNSFITVRSQDSLISASKILQDIS